MIDRTWRHDVETVHVFDDPCLLGRRHPQRTCRYPIERSMIELEAMERAMENSIEALDSILGLLDDER